MAINAGNTALARRNPDTGVLEGIAIALGSRLASHLDCEAEFLVHGSANEILETADRDLWDIAFLAKDPSRADRFAFSRPYMSTEATFAVWRDSGHQSVTDLDRPGLRIGATRNAAYARVLARQMLHATVTDARTAADALDLFVRERLDAVAGIRDALERFALRNREARVLPDSFATIEQALAVPRKRIGEIGTLDRFIDRWLEETRALSPGF